MTPTPSVPIAADAAPTEGPAAVPPAAIRKPRSLPGCPSDRSFRACSQSLPCRSRRGREQRRTTSLAARDAVDYTSIVGAAGSNSSAAHQHRHCQRWTRGAPGSLRTIVVLVGLDAHCWCRCLRVRLRYCYQVPTRAYACTQPVPVSPGLPAQLASPQDWITNGLDRAIP